YQLVFQGKTAARWHIYSQYAAAGGSLPSECSFEGAGEEYRLLGEARESPTIKEYSEIFEVEETFFKKEAVFTQEIELLKEGVNQISVNLFYQICKEVCIPKDILFQITLDGSEFVSQAAELDQRSARIGESLKIDLKNKELLGRDNVANLEERTGLWLIFGLGFLGGFIALLTPCVFPMIPLTVSFFTKQSPTRSKGMGNAVLY